MIERAAQFVSSDSVQSIPVEKIQRNPQQPRQHWDEQRLQELADSIRANGLIQPIIVRPQGDRYQLIAGERRLRAMKLAGKDTIPALVRQASEAQSLEWALIENIHRIDLNCIERARAYEHYLKSFSLTQEEGARRLGQERSTVANFLRILSLPEDIQKMLSDSLISMGHAKALLRLPDDVDRLRLARRIVAGYWSVRQTERRVQEELEPAAKPPARPPKPHIQELEREFSQALGTKVTIRTSGGGKGHRGRIIIEFYSLDDFDRVKEKIQR
ncbi:MAG: ParB/RepB/Spo0J family partition protein [Sedimentisphaerales bacterium]|nr:ParB/RepB/Spo0J family partition protein [Sedimentisphaerales bacterium]